jgi:heptosyltransferase-1
VVTATPVLRGLKRTHPEASVAWLLAEPYVPLLEDDEDVDEIIVFDRRRLGRAWRSVSALGALRALGRRLRQGRFDWAIDLQGLFRSAYFTGRTKAPLRVGFARPREWWAKLFYSQSIRVSAEHTLEQNVELATCLGLDARVEDMTLRVSTAGRRFAERFFAEHGLADRGYVTCVPPTRWPTKLYPTRHWRRLVGDLAGRMPVVLLGAPGERDLCEAVADGLGPGVINAAGQTGVAEMVALIAASAGVVCSDSAAKFIAPAVGVGCVVLIGPTRVEKTGPVGGGRAVVADVACQGCLKRACRHVTCMELIDPAAALSAADAMLAEGVG